MASTLEQPYDSPVVTTTFGGIMDESEQITDGGLKHRGKTDGTAKVSTNNRTTTVETVSLRLPISGATSPHQRWKAIRERKVANNELVKLTLDYGNSETTEYVGKIQGLTKTVRGGQGGVMWVVTIKIACESVTYS